MNDYGIRATSHAWLGIDPGVTTGWALVDDSGALQASGNLPEEHLRTSLDDLVRHLHRGGLRLDAVVENMPRVGGMGPLATRLEEVRRAITDVLEEIYEIPTQRVAPGEWKTSRVARGTKFLRGKKMTPHERDAARMAMYVRDRETVDAE